MAEDLKIAYFRNGAGEVHAVRLPPIEAVNAANKFPWEWRSTPAGSPPCPRAL